MKYRALGKTGLRVSEIGFGAGSNGGILFKTDPNVRREAVRLALDLGINWFDTAPSYGDGQSEENLGFHLRKLGAHVHVSTKVRLQPEELEDVKGATLRSVEGSLKRLGLPRVDLIQVHNAVTQRRGERPGSISIQDVLGENGMVEAFRELRHQGKARFFGYTGLGDTEALHHLALSGQFQTLQVYYNMLNPSAAEEVSSRFSAQDYKGLMSMAAGMGMGVLAIRALAAGALTSRALQVNPGATLSQGSDYPVDTERADKLAKDLGISESERAQWAIRYVLMNPLVSAALIGFSTLDHIRQAVTASEAPPLSPKELRAVQALQTNGF